MQYKIQQNKIMAIVEPILSMKKSQTKSFLPKRMSWFVMNTDKKIKINRKKEKHVLKYIHFCIYF